MMLGDPVELVASLIRVAHPDAEVDTESISSRALSLPKYVFVQATGGGTTEVDQIDNPTIEVVTYSAATSREDALRFAREIQRTLHMAWFEQTTNEHGSIARFSTTSRPRRQQIGGLKNAIRTSATYELMTRPAR